MRSVMRAPVVVSNRVARLFARCHASDGAEKREAWFDVARRNSFKMYVMVIGSGMVRGCLCPAVSYPAEE